MIRLICFFIFLFLGLGCSNTPEKQVEFLSGYWEISSVTLPNGTKRVYRVSQNVDYFFVEEVKGIRKKVQSTLMGNFKATNSFETFSIEEKGSKLYLNYQTNFETWQEEVLVVNADVLIIKNAKNYIYTYKPHTKIQIPQ